MSRDLNYRKGSLYGAIAPDAFVDSAWKTIGDVLTYPGRDTTQNLERASYIETCSIFFSPSVVAFLLACISIVYIILYTTYCENV